jgi:putative membrane protein
MKTLALFLTGSLCVAALVGMAPAQAVQEPATPQKFVIMLANADQAQIQIGELALKNASSDDVKKFAQMMITEHDKCRKDLVNHFKDLKIGVVSALDKRDKELYDELAKLKGADFDRKYMETQVQRHKDAVQFLQTNAKSTDALVKDFSEKQLKNVDDHLKRAQEIQKNLK